MMPASAIETARKVLSILTSAGHEAYLAGGSVRDRLLGLDPQDYDIATSARPDEVERLFRRTLSIGKAFGVICVLMGGRQVEVATFRSEAAYADGRHPDEVKFTDARSDVERRDFTVNGLLLDPASDEVLDYVGGRQDLERRLIRAIGDPAERFGEDGLRLLRAVRFGSFMDFHIEEGTLRAMSDCREGLRRIAPERIREELLKMATDPRCRLGDAWRTLVVTGLAAVVLPNAAERGAVAETADILDALGGRSLALFLAVALRRALAPGSAPKAWRDLGEAAASALRCSNEESRLLMRLLEFRGRYRALPRASRVRKRLAATLPDRTAHEDLLRAEGDAADVLALLMDTRATDGDVLPEPLVRGGELIEAGVPPGPSLGRSLRRLRYLQLAGDVTTRAGALALIKSPPAR